MSGSPVSDVSRCLHRGWLTQEHHAQAHNGRGGGPNAQQVARSDRHDHKLDGEGEGVSDGIGGHPRALENRISARAEVAPRPAQPRAASPRPTCSDPRPLSTVCAAKRMLTKRATLPKANRPHPAAEYVLLPASCRRHLPSGRRLPWDRGASARRGGLSAWWLPAGAASGTGRRGSRVAARAAAGAAPHQRGATTADDFGRPQEDAAPDSLMQCEMRTSYVQGQRIGVGVWLRAAAAVAAAA